MKCSILWKTNKHVLCATEVMLRFRTWWQDTCYSMDDLAEQTDTIIPQEQEVKIPSCSALLKVLLPGRFDPLLGCQLIHGSQPLDHCWRSETKKNDRQQPGSINDTMHPVKEHPLLQTAKYVHSPSSHVIHITVSSTLGLTHRTNHQHFHKENLMEFIYCSVRPLGYTFIYRMKWSALH